jgi:hypothetical protein
MLYVMYDVQMFLCICWLLELLVRMHAVYNIKNIVCQIHNIFHVTEIIFTKHKSNTTY